MGKGEFVCLFVCFSSNHAGATGHPQAKQAARQRPHPPSSSALSRAALLPLSVVLSNLRSHTKSGAREPSTPAGTPSCRGPHPCSPAPLLVLQAPSLLWVCNHPPTPTHAPPGECHLLQDAALPGLGPLPLDNLLPPAACATIRPSVLLEDTRLQARPPLFICVFPTVWYLLPQHKVFCNWKVNIVTNTTLEINYTPI